MKKLYFTSGEVDFLQHKIAEELASTEDYMFQIRDILVKLKDTSEIVSETETISTPVEKKKRGRKPKAVTVQKAEPKKRGRKSKSEKIDIQVTEPAVPAYSLDMSAPKKTKKKSSNYKSGKYKSSGGYINLAPLSKQKNIRDLILEKFPEMIYKIRTD